MRAAARRLLARWNALFDEPGSVRALALLRIAAGPIVIAHLMPFVREMRAGGYYGDHFYVPWASWYPEAPAPLYHALLWAALGCAVLLSLGLLTRLLSAATFALCAYNFFLSQTHFHNNRNFLLIVLAVLALGPSGRVLSIDAWWRRRRSGTPPDDRAPLWPLGLLRCEMSLMYLASGTSKLIDPDWWSGLVTWDRVMRYQHNLVNSPAPRWLVDLLRERDFHTVFAKAAILTELFIGLCVWWKPTRLAAAWVAVCFHFMIEVSAAVQIFSYLGIAAQVVWATPRTRDRVLLVRGDRRAARWLGGAVRALDWMARFEVRRAAGGEGPAVQLLDRGGVERRGAAAARVALSRCPLLFMPVAPMLLPGVRRLWDRLFRKIFA